ncbi:chromosome segregation protein SMC [Candidatus Micrarchaeota archaeon]|nr:chromosome segregation protein SMC [Candidatus Micrarchaeota archaeon]
MFVETVELRNFKSFRDAKIHLVNGFNGIIGPNGSGKSNIVDAILFALGESRIRALRAKKTPDLIHSHSKMAEVDLTLSDGKGQKVNISRAIRSDGKLRYRMNGRPVHKYVIEDFLRANGISTYNIIQQGQVQQIVEMNSKDRRTLVDNIANVLEYEEKKKEAISELDKVQARLSEASVIMGEREGILEKLAKDKAEAERFLFLQKELDQLRATLLSIDLKAVEIEFENSINSMVDLNSKSDQISREISKLSDEINAFQAKKDEIHRKISERSEGKQMVLEKEIESLRTEIEHSKAVAEEKKQLLRKNEEKIAGMQLEKMRAHDEVAGGKKKVEELAMEIKSLKEIMDLEQKKLDAVVSESSKFSSDFFKSKKSFDDISQEMLNIKEQLNAFQAETGKLQEVQKLKENELKRLKTGQKEDYSDKRNVAQESKKKLQHELNEINRQLDALFNEEKELNKRISESEKELLTAKIKSTEITTRLSTSREAEVSRGVQFVLEQKKEEKGIHGTVESLCSYDPKYAVPVQVAIGGRLNYIVVDNVRIAEKMIDQLKQKKLGRVSFIPLDKIKSYELNRDDLALKKEKGAIGFMIELIEFDKKFKKAFEYALTNTLLMQQIKDAESLIGKARLVTMDGSLIEQGGLVTGGSFQERINLTKMKEQLDAFDKKLNEMKSLKESALSDLFDVQEKMAGERKKKSEFEVKVRAWELEIQNYDKLENDYLEKSKDLRDAVKTLQNEIDDAQKQIEKFDEDKNAMVRKLSELNIQSLELKSKIDVEKEKNFGISLKEKEKRLADLKFQYSDYENRMNSMQTQHSAYEREFKTLDKIEMDLKTEMADAQKEIKNSDELMKRNSKIMSEKNTELKSISAAMNDLITEREKLDAQIYKIATQKGKFEFERDKILAEKQKKEVTRAVSETNLTNLKTEFAKYEKLELLKITDKAELVFKSKKAEEELAEIGNINLKAIEEYDYRIKDFDEQKLKVGQLGNERQAILDMISAIEGKKISTFMSAYHAVNQNFMTLFTQIFKGKGTLFLENEANPFEGGLTIKAQIENKEVKYLELMSGGEKSLIAILFLFAIQSYNPSSLYTLDEADAALDQENSRKLALLIKELSKASQIVCVTHNQMTYKTADCLIGVSMVKGASQLVEVDFAEKQVAMQVKA